MNVSFLKMKNLYEEVKLRPTNEGSGLNSQSSPGQAWPEPDPKVKALDLAIAIWKLGVQFQQSVDDSCG